MNFTDIFIRRPVLASVVSLVILVVGLRSFYSLQILQYPKTENGIVTISTAYPGADPDAIAGFIAAATVNTSASAGSTTLRRGSMTTRSAMLPRGVSWRMK